MPGAKKATDQASGKSCALEKKKGSKLLKSLQIGKGNKSAHSKKRRPQPETIAAASTSKRSFSDPSIKGKGEDTRIQKQKDKKVKRVRDTAKSSKKLSSSTQSKKVPDASSKGDETKITGEDSSKRIKIRRKRKKNKKKVELDEATRLQKRTRYLLIKIKLEQNLIDAYSAEGWKGQNKEKIRPEKELQRAKKQIVTCKLGIREAIRQLDLLGSVGRIEDSAIDAEGSVHHEHIFCAKCKLCETSPDNDIILCDGTCNCAFHQKCLDPPLNTESSDHGWLCKNCECKMEILDAVNAHLGTHFSVNCNWQDVFKEEAAYPLDEGSSLLQPEAEWPSDDSEDDDYNPCSRESSSSTGGPSSEDASSSTSLSCSLDEEVESGAKHTGEGVSFLDSDETTDGEILSVRRQRRAVDYRKLYDEMFGKEAAGNELVSEDEDWGPAKKRRRKRESDAASTLITLQKSNKKVSNGGTRELENKLCTEPQSKRTLFRIPRDAVEKLRRAFAENELPPRSVRENLSKELGLDPEKVSKWFKNARYIALKARKGSKQNDGSDPQTSKEPGSETVNEKSPNSFPSKDSLVGTAATNPKRMSIVYQRKRNKSTIIPSKKRHNRRVRLGSPADINQVNMDISDDLSLRDLLRVKSKRKKKQKKKAEEARDDMQAAEAAMERLCQIKCRVESMRQKLKSLQSCRNRKSHGFNDNVVYIPIAVLKEKI